MPLKNTVAVERRMDLASLFCMIGRHGPAVALAVIAMVSVLVAFIIYRTVRGKRRKATRAAADSDSKSRGEERDAAVIQSRPEEAHSSPESTDVSDESSSDVKEDDDLIQSDLKIRHRRAAAAAAATAEKKPPPSSPPNISDIQAPENQHTTSDDPVVWESYKVTETYAEEASEGLPSDTYAVAEMVVENAVDCQQGATDDIVEDVIEEVRDNESSLNEPELITDENYEEEEKVVKAEYQEDEDVTMDKDVSDKKTSQEDENFQCVLNNPVSFEQTPHMDEKADDDRLQDKTTVETNGVESKSEEPVIHIEEVPTPCIFYGKDHEFEEENPDSIDYSRCSDNNRLAPEEDKQNEDGKAEKECVDYNVIAQQAEIWSSTSEQGANLPSTQQDQSDQVTDKVTLPIQDSAQNEDGGLAGEVIEEVVDEDHVNKFIAVNFDDHSPQLDKQEVEIEQKEENDLTHNQEDGVLYDGADQVKEKMLTSDIIACSEEHDSSSVAPSPALSCLSVPQFNEQEVEIEQKEENVLACNQEDGVLYDGADQVKEKMLNSDILACSEEHDSSSVALHSLNTPVKVDNHDDGLSGVTTDAAAQISGIADSPDLSLDCQQSQKEDKILLSLDEDTEFGILGSHMPSHETENQPENHGKSTTVVLAEECINQVYEPHIQSCYKDQQSVQMIDNEVFDKASVAAPDTDESTTPSHIVDEISCPHLPSTCQDQQSDRKEKEETFDETRINSATDAPACDNATITSPVMSEEISHPDILSSSQDQQSVQMVNIEVFNKASVAANPAIAESATASVVVEEMSCPHLPSICQDQQSDHIENNETSPIMSEEISHPEMLFSFQDQQSDYRKNNEDFSEITSGVAPVMTEVIIPPMCQIHSLSFEQSDLRDNDISSPGVGEESGISSMAVSPDAGHEFDVVIENMVLPVMDCDLQSEGQTEAQISLFADDVAVSVINEGTAAMVFGPYPSHPSQVPSSEPKDWTKYESFAANEDMFGHEIEDAYHREMDLIMAQTEASITSFTDELKIKTDMKAVIEIVEIKEKKAGVSVEKKQDTKAEKEKEEDYEKTEISIMEATMDNNEWITESNYPVLPWLIPSAPSFAQDLKKTNHPPTEEYQYSSAVTDTTSVDTTDIPPSTEDKQTSTLSLVEENTENNKKVVAVQPMPQNVNVTFRIHYFTQSPYQTVAVTGNQQELGNWTEFIPLERAKDGHWSTVVSLPAESHVEWKFVVLEKGEVCRWEECGNRLLDTGFGDDLLVHKWWGHL